MEIASYVRLVLSRNVTPTLSPTTDTNVLHLDSWEVLHATISLSIRRVDKRR